MIISLRNELKHIIKQKKPKGIFLQKYFFFLQTHTDFTFQTKKKKKNSNKIREKLGTLTKI